MKRSSSPYHSALWAEAEAEPCQRVEFPNGIAFQHDIRNGLPAEFQACDVIYAEPPWPAGFEKFNQRASQLGGDYRHLIEAIGEIVMSVSVPAFLITGDRGTKLLPTPLQQHRILLNGAPAWCVAYRRRIHDWPDATEGLQERFAQEFSCIGDFCCGYGRSGRIFTHAGKRFVLSDYNPKCIGHIAKFGKDWS